MEHAALVGTALYTGFRFINFGMSTYRNAQYIKNGVQSHMNQGMTEREAIFYEHGYAHDQPIKSCMSSSCASLA